MSKLGVRRWTEFRRRILERDMYRCRYAYEGCTRDATEVDHLIDRQYGGPVYDEANCFSVCASCHKEKDRRRRRGERIGVFLAGSARETRPISDLHTPKIGGSESGPLLRGDYRREPLKLAGNRR